MEPHTAIIDKVDGSPVTLAIYFTKPKTYTWSRYDQERHLAKLEAALSEVVPSFLARPGSMPPPWQLPASPVLLLPSVVSSSS